MSLLPYLRYSPRPKNAADRCDSPEVQLAACQRYATLIGAELQEAVRDDLVSARTVRLQDRPGGQELLRRLLGASGVVVQRLDRLFRDAADGITTLREWREDGQALHLADQGGCAINGNTATGRMILHTLLVQAEFEPDMIAERTAGAMKWKQKNGHRMSDRPPYGWKRDPADPAKLVEHERQQALIADMKRRAGKGESPSEIAARLRAFLVPTATGHGSWTATTVRRILKRAAG